MSRNAAETLVEAINKINNAPNSVEAYNVNYGDLAWSDYSSCKGGDSDIFDETITRDPSLAKSVCEKCVVIEPCLRYGLTFETEFNESKGSMPFKFIFGGKTLAERQEILNQTNVSDDLAS